MTRHISHSIEIDATPARIWSILTDTPSFASWNPFITKIDGELRVGAKLTVQIQSPGGCATTFHPTVLAAQRETELRWLGRVLVPGPFDGEHSFRLEPISPQRTRFTQAERFSGILVAPLRRTIARTEVGFKQMNESLKARSEAGGGAG
jgi:hypothetical protein